MKQLIEQWIPSFWKMLDDCRFIKSTNSITDEVDFYDGGITDMEATVQIHGEFDKYAIEDWHKQSLKQFIDGLITWQEEEVRHPLETVEHLKEIRKQLE